MTELVRFIAIVMIVLGHFEIFDYGGGASYTLFLIAGYTYSKYILPKIYVSRGAARRLHLLLILKVSTPVVLYSSLLQLLYNNEFDKNVLFLVSNWFGHDVFSYWFIEVYIQINLIFFIALFYERSCKYLEYLGSIKGAFQFFVGSVVIATIANIFLNTQYLYDRVPHQMLWFFVGGILFGAVQSSNFKWLFLGLMFFSAWWVDKISGLLLISVVLITTSATCWVGKIPKLVVEHVASASLMIYLTHFQWLSLWRKLFPGEAGVGAVFFAIGGGVFLSILYSELWGLMRQRLEFVLSKYSLFKS